MPLITTEHISNYKRTHACLKSKNGCYSNTSRSTTLLERKDAGSS